jgi:hypothetical protein
MIFHGAGAAWVVVPATFLVVAVAVVEAAWHGQLAN